MIQVSNVRPINKGDLLATCSVHIVPWKLKINKVAVFQRGVNRWVAMPRDKYESNGETKYDDIMEWDDDSTKRRFRDQVTASIDEYIKKNGDMVAEDVVKQEDQFPF